MENEGGLFGMYVAKFLCLDLKGAFMYPCLHHSSMHVHIYMHEHSFPHTYIYTTVHVYTHTCTSTHFCTRNINTMAISESSVEKLLKPSEKTLIS